MNKIKYYFKNIDKVLLFSVIFMLFFGLLNIVTSSSREAVLVNKQGIFYYFYRQMAILTIGAIGFIVVSTINTKKYKKLGAILYALVLGLVVYCFFMSAKRGAQNWFVIPGINFQFQPSELAKPTLIICVSMLFEYYFNRLRDPECPNHRNTVWLVLTISLIIPIMIFLQKDLGTASIILFIMGILFFASPIPGKEKWSIVKKMFVILIAGGCVLYFVSGHILTEAQLARFDFFNPCSKYETGGYQTCNAYIALNDGGLFGLGIGKSKQKYSYIPEPHTDSIFAIIGEEWGVIWCLLCVFLPYIIILWRICLISSTASTIRGRYICLGVATYIFAHILINLGGLFGLIPLTGVPLPFLSYGGTYTVCLIVSIALVERVCFETRTRKIKLK